jgi:hypothetical protein
MHVGFILPVNDLGCRVRLDADADARKTRFPPALLPCP